jgi:hypothetical protein
MEGEKCGFFSHLDHTKKKYILKSAANFVNPFSYETEDNNTLLTKYFRALPDSKGL